MTMQWTVTLHSKESAIVHCVIAIVNTSIKDSPHHCPAMDMKKLKKRGNVKNCEFKKDPEKSN